MPEVQVRSELACERPHRVILRSGRNAQARVALASCFCDEPPEQNRADALPSHRGEISSPMTSHPVKFASFRYLLVNTYG